MLLDQSPDPSADTFTEMSRPPSAHHGTRPELLAPAGDWDCLRAAVENGADAVYFGLDAGFNARVRAHNFSAEELPAIMDFLHRRGVRGYVTFNTLVFTSELAAAEQLIATMARAGVDAVLVQDLGMIRLIQAITPDLPIHASTQMTLTSAEGIRFVASLGVERVVLARELSLREMGKIHRQTDTPIEAFVHGALCVAYSGQCLTSESLGGRSANRGHCAQACRLPYDLLCDGREVDTADVKYLLSPQDLAAYELVPDLLAAGICSLKIEGRLKTPEYVANITRHYREAIDTALAGRPVRFTPQQIEEMELSFSRGFSPGWLAGCHHKRLVPGTSSSKRGVPLGEVVGCRRGRVAVRLSGSIKRGDGVVFDCGRPVDDEQGGRVYEVFREGRSEIEPQRGGIVELTFAHGALDFDEITIGQKVWKNDDPELTSRLRRSFTGTDPVRRQPLDLLVIAAAGRALRVTARTELGVSVTVESEQPLAVATRHALSESTLREQFGRLGGTNYELRGLQTKIDGQPMAPFSVLGKLRHALVEQLDAAVVTLRQRRVADRPLLPELRQAIQSASRAENSSAAKVPVMPTLRVLARSLPQLRALLRTSVRQVYVDFQDPREYHEAVAVAREHGAEIFLATPRIQKPDEMGIFRLLVKMQADGILTRNLSGMLFFRQEQIPIVADFSLNVANELTAQLLHELQPQRITPSYDLNREQLIDLVQAVPAEWLEVVVHQHMPMFHMEHCVFCAMLSPGTNKTNCGRPCDRHEVKLRDRLGMEHPLKADIGCRNTLFNATPQSAAEIVPQLLQCGVRNYRVELLDDSAEQLELIVTLYSDLLAGRVPGREVWSRLQAMNRVGVTRGTLEERRNPLAIL
jgi:putative protease